MLGRPVVIAQPLMDGTQIGVDIGEGGVFTAGFGELLRLLVNVKRRREIAAPLINIADSAERRDEAFGIVDPLRNGSRQLKSYERIRKVTLLGQRPALTEQPVAELRSEQFLVRIQQRGTFVFVFGSDQPGRQFSFAERLLGFPSVRILCMRRKRAFDETAVRAPIGGWNLTLSHRRE